MEESQILSRLQIAFPGSEAQAQDLSGTGSNWQIFIRSKVFEGLSRLQRHQKVMEVFRNELDSGEIHALTIKTDI